MSYGSDVSTAYGILLSRVPYPIQAERREDYHVDLSAEGPDRHPPAPYHQPTGQQPPTDGYSPGAVALAHKERQPENGAEHTGAKGPWYRTRWGITAIVIVIVVIVGGIVGGVVGGTHHSSSRSNNGNGGAGIRTGSSTPYIATSGGGGDISSSPNQSNSVRTTSSPNSPSSMTPPGRISITLPPSSTVTPTGNGGITSVSPNQTSTASG